MQQQCSNFPPDMFCRISAKSVSMTHLLMHSGCLESRDVELEVQRCWGWSAEGVRKKCQCEAVMKHTWQTEPVPLTRAIMARQQLHCTPSCFCQASITLLTTSIPAPLAQCWAPCCFLLYHFFNSFLMKEFVCVLQNNIPPPPFLIKADHQSQRSLSHHFQHLLLIPLAALLLTKGTDPCHHRHNVHYVGIAAVIQQSGTFLHSANWCLEAATCIQ